MSQEYIKAKKLAEREMWKLRFEGKETSLPALDSFVQDCDSLPSSSLGVQEIPLRMIKGTKTKGRANAFAPNFMPIMKIDSEFATKWNRLYDAQMNEGIHDPIKVYEYKLQFYVQEGNKRVSVLKYLDVPSIEAEVIRILPRDIDSNTNQIYREFLQFYTCAPIYDITFTKPGSYQTFAKVVHHTLDTKWDRDFINVVRGAYFRFLSVFIKKGGNSLPITAGDAFLKYLNVYQFDSLLDRTKYDIDVRLDEVWKEILLQTKDVKVSVLEKPLESQKSLIQEGIIYNENRPLNVLFIYDDDPHQEEWSKQHEQARITLEQTFQRVVKTNAIVSYPTIENLLSIRQAITNNDVIFVTGFRYINELVKEALKYPKKKFFYCGTYLNYCSVMGYYGRMYEAMFLLGRVAARYASNHKIGFVSNIPLAGKISEINAFAIGASLVDTKCQIYLKWANQKDCDYHDFFTHQQIQVYVGETDDAQNKMPVHHLYVDGKKVASPVWHCDVYYAKMIQSILERKLDRIRNDYGNIALYCWWGMDSGVIDIALEDTVDWITKKDISTLKQMIAQGNYHPFAGELHSQNECIQEENAADLTAVDIISMKWLNHNIVGSIPTMEELDEQAQRVMKESGTE